MYVTENERANMFRTQQNLESAINECRARFGSPLTFLFLAVVGMGVLAMSALRFFLPGIIFIVCAFGIMRTGLEDFDVLFAVVPPLGMGIGFLCIILCTQPRLHASGYRKLYVGGIILVARESSLSEHEENVLEQTETATGWGPALLFNSAFVSLASSIFPGF